MSSYFTKEEISGSDNIEVNILKKILNAVEKIKNYFMDKLFLFFKVRWVIVLLLFILYLYRLLKTEGFQALTYCLGIHLLNSFIGFISPLNEPEESQNTVEEEEEITNLPTGENNPTLNNQPRENEEEFRPFQRKVKEFEFWEILFISFLIGDILTFFPFFDIPVYWPILLAYFILLFIFTMRQQISRMIKFKYLPWDNGKTEYNPKN